MYVMAAMMLPLKPHPLLVLLDELLEKNQSEMAKFSMTALVRADLESGSFGQMSFTSSGHWGSAAL